VPCETLVPVPLSHLDTNGTKDLVSRNNLAIQTACQ
jgi:hypothetical protein